MRLLSAGDDPAEPEPLRRAVECLRFVFSDTVILVSTDDTEDAAEDVLFCAWRMSQFSIAGGLPLRGGVDESVVQQFPRLFPEDPKDYATGYSRPIQFY